MSRGTFSKHPSRYPAGYPVAISSGSGCWVWDTRGTKYLDLSMGLAAAGVLGHACPAVTDAVRRAVNAGTVFHLPHAVEQLATEELLEFLDQDWAEDVRYALNGTDATASAVRLARAVTGVTPIITFRGAYHGASGVDWFAAGQHPARGVDLNNVVAPTVCVWNDVQSLRSVHYPIAAIIFEVGEVAPTPEFIAMLRATCARHRAVLIADEVVTGFRLHKAGACGLYGINPDLACYGKALGSGVPISALVGRRDLMSEFDLAHTHDPVFMSYTNAANSLGLAAMRATLREIRVVDALARVWKYGEAMNAAFKAAAAFHGVPFSVTGQPPRSLWRLRDVGNVTSAALSALFQQRMCDKKVLTGVANCPTIYHDNIPCLAEALDAALGAVALAISRQSVEGLLEGDVPTPLYVRKPA